ncbi:putative cytochrome P450 [Helianthus annuus]|nr:putative cytochrome P450 [Helianthus annuus]
MDSLPILLYVILSLLTLFLLSSFRRKPYPPGPRGWPIIGNMLMMDQLTHRGLASLAEKYGGILHLKMGFGHTVAVSSAEMARQVLQVQDNIFPTVRPPSPSPLAPRLPRRARVRVTHDIIYRAAFGSISHEGKEEFIKILQEYTKLFGAFNLADFIPWLGFIDPAGLNTRLPKARAALDGFIDKIIDEHLTKKKKTDEVDNDMVDEMLAFYGEEGKINEGEDLQNAIRLTRNNIKAIIMVCYLLKFNLHIHTLTHHTHISPTRKKPYREDIFSAYREDMLSL